jgi:ABC-type sugar transport system permease subunit
MKIIIVLAAIYALFPLTWVLYLAIMNLSGHRNELKGFARFNAYCIVLPTGYLFDALLNLIVCAIFLRFPQDWLLTGTLKRYLNTDTGWRCAVAAWICANLLDPFDPSGAHCN